MLALTFAATAAFLPAVRDVRSLATQPRFAAAPLMWEFAVPEEDMGWEHDQKRKRKPPAAAAGASERVEPEEATVLEELHSHEIVAAEVDDIGTALSAANEADAQVLLAEEAVEQALGELAKAKDKAAALNRAVPQSGAKPPRGKLRVESPAVGSSGNSLAGRNKAAVEQAPRAAKMGAAPASEDAPLDAPLDLNTAFLQAARWLSLARLLPPPPATALVGEMRGDVGR